MARDLIPPPSPAGRPGSSAEAERERARELEEQRRKQKGGLWHRSSEDEATTLDSTSALVSADPDAASDEARDLAGRPQPDAPTPYRSRFGLLMGALLGLAIAAVAVGAAVYVGTNGDNGAPDGWSSWRPTADDGAKAAAQIAAHVGKEYRQADGSPDGSQIVGVEGGPLQIEALGLTVPLSIAMRTAPQGGNINFIEGDHGLLYTLNGLGPKGSIRGGKVSTQRALLMRREALELALYSFRYIHDVDQVVALLPPKPPAKTATKKDATVSTPATASDSDSPSTALFFRPGDLQPQMEIPLGATIPPKTPRPGSIAGAEARRVDALTRGNMFLYSFQQSQNQKAYIVLDRLPQ